MLRFAHIEFLWGLAAIPLFIILFIAVSRWKRKSLAALGDRAIIQHIMPDVSLSRPKMKFTFWVIAYALLLLGAADPQVGTKTEEAKRQGSDIMILLDVSNSMLSQDFAPNRLENAKMAIAQLIDNLHDDRIGIIVFAGEAYVQLPITSDYSAAKLFLNTINTQMVPTQGTAIGAAIDMGVKSLDFKGTTSKAMILMTDGENHEDDAVAAAEAAQDKGVVIHVIGFGSPQGSPIPVFDAAGKQTGFHLDSAGKTVISKLNEPMCEEIATAGHGIYIRASNANSGMGTVLNEIGKMKQKTYDTRVFKGFEDRFQFFLGAGLVLLLVEFFISNRKSLRLSNLKLFEVKKEVEA